MQIDVSGLHKSYLDGEGRHLEILKGLDFQADAGDSVAIVGASGAGKSTLLHLLGALEPPNSGTLLIQGEPLHLLSRNARARFRNHHIGFIFQFHQLLQDFTALENVAMPLLIRGDLPSQAQETAKRLLGQVGLDKRTGHKPNQLSGGEQQRVAVARALVGDPEILLADEPTGNLDIETGTQVVDLLLDLNRERNGTLVMITHNLALAQRMARQLRLEEGTLRPTNPPPDATNSEQ